MFVREQQTLGPEGKQGVSLGFSAGSRQVVVGMERFTRDYLRCTDLEKEKGGLRMVQIRPVA